jgi:hypothetical protein
MSQSETESLKLSQSLKRIQEGELFAVSSRRRNGVILRKPYHMEFAGPGAVVGGVFDRDCQSLIPVGKLSLDRLESSEEQHRAYLIRRQWVLLIKQLTEHPDPQERARMILNQFENYFDSASIAQLSDEVFAQLVGVLPCTVRQSRESS